MSAAAVERELKHAVEAAEKGDASSALQHALAAWRKGRGARLAALVELASTSASRGKRPIIATSSMQAAWLERAAAKDPSDLPELLKLLSNGRNEQILPRFDVLATWPDDPRIHRRLVELLVEPPLAGKAGRPVSQRVFKAMLASRDHELARIASAMVAHEAPYQYVRPRLRKMAAFIHAEFLEVAEALQRFKAPPPLSAEASRLSDRFEAVLKVERKDLRSGEELLAAVYASPGDDQCRLVYADWLTEQGDPRGEFIVLQCERARSGTSPTKRERALEKQYARIWAEPLAPKLSNKSLVFSRGFLSEASVMRLRQAPAGFHGHPAWATVEVVRFDNAGMTEVELVNHASCSSVKAVLGLAVSELPRLKRQVERLGITYFHLDEEVEAALLRQNKLRCLEVDDDSKALRAFLEAKLPWVEELRLS